MKLKTLKYRIGNLVYNTLQVPRITNKRHYNVKNSANGKQYKVYYGKPYKAYLYNKDNEIRTRKVKSLNEFKSYYDTTDSDGSPDSNNILKKALATLLSDVKENDTSHADEQAGDSNPSDDSGNGDDGQDQPKREDQRQNF